MMQSLKVLFLSIFCAMLLSGCIYKIDVQQGNVITDNDLAKIHPGMNTLAVKKILGDPILNNVYHDNRLIYVYTMKRGRNRMTKRSVFIYFSGNKVTRIEKHLHEH